jgi:hypothetical protein
MAFLQRGWGGGTAPLMDFSNPGESGAGSVGEVPMTGTAGEALTAAAVETIARCSGQMQVEQVAIPPPFREHLATSQTLANPPGPSRCSRASTVLRKLTWLPWLLSVAQSSSSAFDSGESASRPA